MEVKATSDLVAGMVTAKPVCTKAGQVIIQGNVSLTEQMISHLGFYGIHSVSVFSESECKDACPPNADIINYQQQVKDNIEYKYFKQSFLENVEYLKHYINDVIIKNEVAEGEGLLEQTLNLFNSLQGTVNIFDILHCIRKIDDSTYAHSVNVAIICRLMGQWLGKSKEDIDVLTLCGLLHDIGKCKTPRSILTKPGELTAEEYNIVKRHPINGYALLKSQPLDPRIKRCALMHHERCDGTGYPLGLLKDDIDDFAVIVSIADVYDAMTTARCYRDALCPFEVIATFEREGFHKYNPSYVTTFLNHIVDSYMNNQVLLNNGNKGQIVWKNKEQLARPTLYLPSQKFLDLTKHPELFIESII